MMFSVKDKNGTWVEIPALLGRVNDSDVDKSLNRVLPQNQTFKNVIDEQINDYLTKNEPSYSLTPSQVVQIYNEIKQESEG